MQSRRNNKVYVGKTSKEPKARLEEHNNGANTWSKNNGQFKLVYYEKYFCLKDASQRELFYKTGIGRNIKKLIVEYFSTISTGRSSDG